MGVVVSSSLFTNTCRITECFVKSMCVEDQIFGRVNGVFRASPPPPAMVVITTATQARKKAPQFRDVTGQWKHFLSLILLIKKHNTWKKEINR